MATHQEHQPPWPPPPSISKTGGDTATSTLLVTWMSLIYILQVRPLSQRCTTRPWHRSLFHSEMDPSLGPGFAAPLDDIGLDKPMEDHC